MTLHYVSPERPSAHLAVNLVPGKLCQANLDDAFIHVRPVCGDGDAGHLRFGSPQPVVHPGVCVVVPPRVGLRIPARRVALWIGGGDLVDGGPVSYTHLK